MKRTLKVDITKASEIMRKRGIKSLFKEFINYLFKYQKRYIFHKDVRDFDECTPKIKNLSFKIIYTKKELYDLLKKGLTIDPPFDINNFEKRLDQHQIGFCVFIKKELAHHSWIVMDNNEIELPLNIDSVEEAFVWGVVTSPQYRGLGLYPYTLLKICEFLKEKGKLRAILTSLKDNIPAIRAVTKVDFKVCGELYYLKVFLWEFWKEKESGHSSNLGIFENA